MQDQGQAKTEYSSGSGCLARLYWMFAGNALLFFAFAYLVQEHPKFPSVLDAVCLAVLASLVLVRFIDIRHCKGENADSSAPATMADWRKYSLFLALGSAGLWLAIRLLVPLFVK